MQDGIHISRRWLLAGVVSILVVPLLFAGTRAVAATTCFNDVDDSKWYEPFVCWAADNGVVSGFPDGSFKPEDPVTRAEVTAIAQRMAETGWPTISLSEDTRDWSTTLQGGVWQDVPRTLTLLTVPSDGSLVTARFTAESRCVGGAYASVRLTLAETEMAPVGGADFAFDSSDSATEGGGSWESHSVERSLADVDAGRYAVEVQVNNFCDEFRLDDWILVATAWPPGTQLD